MRVRKLVLFAVLLALFLVYTVTYTVAYLSDQREAENQLVFGEVQVELQETDWNAPKVVQPGNWTAKDPKIKNTGNVPCYVRATVSISDAVGNNQSMADYVQLDALNTGWTASGSPESGKLLVYYSDILEPGESTTPIFDGFLLKESTGGNSLLEGANRATLAEGGNFAIVVTAEAVQTRAQGYDIQSAQDAFTKLLPTGG